MTAVFDLDNTLVVHIPTADFTEQDADDLERAGMLYFGLYGCIYIYHPLVHTLFEVCKRLGLKIGFFSAGKQCRNERLVERLLRHTWLDYAPKIRSRRHVNEHGEKPCHHHWDDALLLDDDREAVPLDLPSVDVCELEMVLQDEGCWPVVVKEWVKENANVRHVRLGVELLRPVCLIGAVFLWSLARSLSRKRTMTGARVHMDSTIVDGLSFAGSALLYGIRVLNRCCVEGGLNGMCLLEPFDMPQSLRDAMTVDIL